MIDWQEKIRAEITFITNFLLEKNKKYGDSAFEPIAIFSDGNTEQLLCARIDDKLKRIKNKGYKEDDDLILDLIGYLIILRTFRKNQKK